MSADSLQDQLQTTLGSAYTVKRELGGGGMSRVFVAGEIALGREVVVKVLPAEMAAQLSLERFEREILLAARLQHPHIVPLLTAGIAGGLPYFTMPYVDGETLRARIKRAGELPIADAVRLLREIASALAYAHEQGVVHRDIKPDNVLLSNGSAMVTDFGVAKALSTAETGFATLTGIGLALGTPAYMAPEQASADPSTDHRADIYAFGVVAYEALTGELPFPGRTAQQMLAAHATETPEHVTRRRSSVPEPLARLVMRCLEKRPADRPQTAKELVAALDGITSSRGTPVAPVSFSGRRRVLIGAATLVVVAAGWIGFRVRQANAAVPSLAVLAFENADRDSASDYLAEGIGDEVRSALTGVPSLIVKARGSSVQFRSSRADVRDAAAKLSANVLLVGSVSKIGTHLHITAELVDAPDGNARWSGTFDTQPEDLARVRDSIVHAVAGSMHADRLALGRATSIDPGAHDMLMRGEHIVHSMRGPNEFHHAIELFRAAIARDSNYAEAYAALALGYAMAVRTGVGSRDSLLNLARGALDRARELAPGSVETLRAETEVLADEFRSADALRILRKAIEERPNDADLRSALANVLSYRDLSGAIEEVRRARELDPLNIAALLSEEYFQYLKRDFRASLNVQTQVFELDPDNVLGLQNMLVDYVFLRLPDSAVARARDLERIDARSYGARVFIALAYASAGQWKKVDEQRALWEQEPRSNSREYESVVMHIVDGRYDDAAAALERSMAAYEPLLLITSVACDPLLDPLKTNARYKAVLNRVNAKPCAAAAQWPIPRRGE